MISKRPEFRYWRLSALLALVVALSACARPELTGEIYDPNEAQNRQMHEINKKLDRALVRPVALSYGRSTPEELRIAVGNFASNLSLPSTVLNDILQLQLGDAIHNTARFVLNTTVGLGGLLDPASQAGLGPRDTDFGETLYVWGFGEGAYVELPLLGPSTTRDAVGKIVDMAINPLNRYVPAPQKYFLPVASVMSRLGDRYRFGTTVDSILYESADSYAQSRLLYLESRRFQLGVEVKAQDDIYEGLYDEILSE
jgi:phospholipid-binding lipoprotein MlaA